MFDSLTERLSGIFRQLGGAARLDEKNIQDGLRQVRLALLEADVHLKVVREFTEKVRERCLGLETARGLNPTQHIIQAVHTELVDILGGENQELQLQGKGLRVIMLTGLQGSGKTTSAAKLAAWLRGHGRSPYLVPVDVYRPAAIEQLVTLARQLDIPCYPSSVTMRPVDITGQALRAAVEAGCDTLLLDTAGRLHIDETLMDELVALKKAADPAEILFVADAMTGQEAVTAAEAFDLKLGLTGVVLTKMDGDARGGAALSIKSVLGKGIKFVGVGEKISDLEPFHPERAAGRILGMGDMLTLLEKTQEHIAAEDAEKLARKLQKAEFDLEDFRANMRRVKKLGSLEGIFKLIPGLSGLQEKLRGAAAPEKELARVEAIINSMTPAERRCPKLLNGSRRLRVARGSGVSVTQVNQMLKQFEAMRGMMKDMLGAKRAPRLPGLSGLAGLPALPGLPGASGPEAGRGGTPLSKNAKKKKKLLRKARKNKRK